MSDHAAAEALLEPLLLALEQSPAPLDGTLQPVSAATGSVEPPFGAPQSVASYAFASSLQPPLHQFLPALETPHLPLDAVADGLGVHNGRCGCRCQHEHCDRSAESSHNLSSRSAWTVRREAEPKGWLHALNAARSGQALESGAIPACERRGVPIGALDKGRDGFVW